MTRAAQIFALLLIVIAGADVAMPPKEAQIQATVTTTTTGGSR